MIKRYLEFIRESEQLSLFSPDDHKIVEKNLEERSYRLDNEKIEETLVEFKDAGYTITIERGYVEEKTKYNWNGPNTTQDEFSQKVIKGNIRPAYLVSIAETRPTSDDVTDSILTIIDYLEDQDFEVELMEDDSSRIEIDKLEIKGGFFIKDESGDITQDIQIEDNIGIFIKDNKEVTVSAEDICKYYNWLEDKDTFIEDGSIYTIIGLEDLAGLLLSNSDNSNYVKQLVGGIDVDYYWGGEYAPDTQSLFSYDLDKDNEILLVKALILEHGGLEEFLIAAELDENLTEEKAIEYLLKESYYSTLTELCNDSEIVREVKEICGDYSSMAHQEANYKELVSDFDDIVGDSTRYAELTYTKFDKEVEVSTTRSDGTKYTYPEVRTFYKIMYENEWLEDFDYNWLKGESLYDIFREHSHNNIGTFELNPSFSDYGDVDRKELNGDIKYLLDNYIEKNPS